MLDIAKLDAIVFDFDGVLTDNRVYVDQNGNEMVCCNRSDGLAFDALRGTHLKVFIISTETNLVVAKRGEKLKIPVFHGVNNKKEALQKLVAEEKFALARTMYVGNDLNDLYAMQICGFSACPLDSHPEILNTATFKLNKPGGHGVVRDLVERVLAIDILASTSFK